MRVSRFRKLIVALLASVFCGAEWSIDSTYEDPIQPGSNFSVLGSKPQNEQGQIKLYWHNPAPTFLCDHAIQTSPEEEDWSSEFNPGDDYNPPGSWPVTDPGTQYLLLKLVPGGEDKDAEMLECVGTEGA